MRGAEPRPFRRLMPWLVVLLLLAMLAALSFWARQQDAARRAAEVRADAAEGRLVEAEASMTAISRTASAATATAIAESNQPEVALRRALDLVFEAYKEPTEGRLRAMSAAFGAEALSFERGEAEHLISAGMHLGGNSAYEMQVMSTNLASPDQAQIRTHEVWTYDEMDEQGRRARCVREESEQTYTLNRVSSGWLVDEVQLSGATRRADC
ncbi:MAG TPA: hypothetical protein VFG86_11165 [Chloroflexota bacterium]|nr:hypothetical protein [Chloroflexota bacterium]